MRFVGLTAMLCVALAGCVIPGEGFTIVPPMHLTGALRDPTGQPLAHEDLVIVLEEAHDVEDNVKELRNGKIAKSRGMSESCAANVGSDEEGKFEHVCPERSGLTHGLVVLPIPFALREGGAGTGEINLLLYLPDRGGLCYLVWSKHGVTRLYRIGESPEERIEISPSGAPPASSASVKRTRKRVDVNVELVINEPFAPVPPVTIEDQADSENRDETETN